MASFFEDPVDSYPVNTKFGESLLTLNDESFKTAITAVLSSWLDNIPFNTFEMTLESIFSLPWTTKMVEIFRADMISREFTREQGSELVEIFRRVCPSIFGYSDILMKFKPYGIRPEIQAWNVRVRAINDENANIRYVQSSVRNAELYTPWLIEDTKIPSEYDFLRAYRAENLECSSITGDIQAGKTSLAIKLSHKSVLSGIPAVYVIMSRKAGHLQLDQRLFDYNNAFKTWCETNRCEYKPLEYVFQADKTAVVHQRVNNFLNFQRRSPGLIIVYANVAQLKRVLEIRLSIAGKCPFTLIVDEVDENSKQDGASMTDPFTQLHDLADSYIGITATSFKYWWMEKKLMNFNCYVLEPHKDYRGIKNLQLDQPIDESIFAPRTSDPFHKTDHQFEGYLKRLESIKGYHYTDKLTGEPEYHPVMCLYRVSDINKYHTEVFTYMRKYNRMKWCCVQFDGEEGANIKLYHSDIASRSDVMVLPGKSYRPDQDGIYTIDKNSISQVIGYLRRLMTGQDSFKNIMIVTGKLASRQISYVCDEYNWHLTHMRLLRASSSNDCTELMQQMRLCGIFRHDDIPLHLSIKEREFADLQKAYALQQSMIGKSADDVPREMCESVYGTESVGFAKSLIPGMRLQKVIPKRAVKIIADEMTNPREDESKEGIRLIVNAYRKGDTIIARLINLFIARKFESLSVDELRVASGSGSFNISNYDKWGQHNQYKVVVRCQSGKYNLNPDVFQALNL